MEYLRTISNAVGIIVGTALWGFALLLLPVPTGLILGMISGLMVLLFVLPFIPRVVEPFMIQPNRHSDMADKHGKYPESRSGFFTDLQQGRVKIKVTWNGSFVTMLMDYDGRRFTGEDPNNPLRPDQQGYWEVVESNAKSNPGPNVVESNPGPNAEPGELPDSHPLPFPAPKRLGSRRWLAWMLYAPLSFLWWAWTRQVYALTGAVWVGIPGFRTLRIYPLERFEAHNLPDGTRELVHKWDYSDHYRVADFQLGIRVPSADTNDMMPISVEFNEVGRVTNPFQVAFNTDDKWPQRFLASGAAAINTYTRQKSVRDVLAAKDEKSAEEMAKVITERVSESLDKIGIIVVESQYIDISTVNARDAEMLGDVARAEVDKIARELRAQGDASPVREIGKALREYPEAAQIPALDAKVRAVQAAGDKAIIFFGNDSDKPMDAVQIQQLRELNKRLAPPETP